MLYAKKVVVIFLTFLIVIAAPMIILSGCVKSASPLSEQTFALDTIVTVTFYRERDRAAVQEALALCRDYELVFSRTDSRSELYRLNEADRMEVSDGLRTVLETALDYCRASGGKFDVTMGGVSGLYGFSEAAPHAPAPEALAEALSHVGYKQISIDGSTVRIADPETVVDLGAAAKGFIADEMKAYLAAHGVEHAIISLGGNVLTLGGKPDGSEFRVGIQYPEKDSTQLVTTVAVSDYSVVTSGVYERFFVEDGVTYHHILDPETGMPLRNGLLAVSIVGPCSLDCDALSTACFALGPEDGMALIEKTDGYEAVFITEDKALHRSSGFAALEK